MKGDFIMELKTKYITADDFKQYFGIDLEAELKTNDNPSNEVTAFLKRIENRMCAFINARFYKNVDIDYKHFTDYQKEHYKLALLEQANYVLTQGDVSVDSGYDIESGVKADRKILDSIKISSNAIDELILCGLWNRKIKNRGRGALDGWWL